MEVVWGTTQLANLTFKVAALKAKVESKFLAALWCNFEDIQISNGGGGKDGNGGCKLKIEQAQNVKKIAANPRATCNSSQQVNMLK